MDDTTVKGYFQQFVQGAQDLLSDFREVTFNFSQLDREIREMVATWDKGKGELVGKIFGDSDAIKDSDQGKSFFGFQDLLISPARRRELDERLAKILKHPAIKGKYNESEIKNIFNVWHDASRETNRKVGDLSHQLRRQVDDKYDTENRRLIELFRTLEAHALRVRNCPPSEDNFLEISGIKTGLNLPMERPLYTVTKAPVINDHVLADSEEGIEFTGLFKQKAINKGVLIQNVRRALAERQQVTLGEVLLENPLEQGLKELLTYYHLNEGFFQSVIDEKEEEEVRWTRLSAEGEETVVVGQIPKLTFYADI